MSMRLPTSMRVPSIWGGAGLLSVLATLIVFFPAAWLAPLVQARSGGRLALLDPQGTVWNGSALLGIASGASGPVTPLAPGRFSWRLSPSALVGSVELRLDNPAALSQPVQVAGNWRRWRIGRSAVSIPAERLSALGAPLNTLQPSGKLALVWDDMQLALEKDGLHIAGLMTLDLVGMASRLSAVRPLGSYRMTFAWRQRQADTVLTTLSGPMLLAGRGRLADGRLAFSGTAQAAEGQDEKLANLLNLLGQRRQQDGKTIIGLEFS